MAPTKVKSGKAKGNNKRSTKPDSSGSSSKNKNKSRSTSKVSKPIGKSKTKRSGRHGPRTHRDIKESELELPKLNAITPVGVQKPKGKKKGKIFVDDKESMMTILALVNAEKEGQIESKMMKERQLEEIRQARQREMEARAQEKKTKLEATKTELRQSKKRSNVGSLLEQKPSERLTRTSSAKPKKRVSFG